VRYATALIVLALLAGCGGDDDQSTPLDTMERARTAILHDDPETACGLLTDHGRERVRVFQADFASSSPPQSCEEVFRAERDRDPVWRDDLEQVEFRVTEENDDRAEVQMTSEFVDYTFTLVKTDDGWRVDDASDDLFPTGSN
jgi:hypothetical protein